MRQRARLRPLAALEGIELVAQIDRRVAGEDLDRFDALATEAVEDLLGQLIAFLDEQLVLSAFALGTSLLRLGLRCVVRRGFTGQRDVLGDDRAEHFALVRATLTLLGQIEVALREEEPQDVAVLPEPEGAKERRGRELLLLVDVDVDDIVDVDRELDPRAAERNDPRADETLAVGVRRLFEDDTGRPVELGDDDTLRPVDHERPECGDERQLTEIDLFLDDVAWPLLAVDLLEDDELQRRFERC